MAKFAGWIAAIGGLLALVGNYVAAMTAWAVPLGGVIAIIFGIWAVFGK